MGGPLGQREEGDAAQEGIVDFARRRMHVERPTVVDGVNVTEETLLDGDGCYRRTAPAQGWSPEARDDGTEAAGRALLRFSSPWWSLGALGRARGGAVLGHELVRGMQTTRIGLTLDVPKADRPTGRPFVIKWRKSIPTEVWLDVQDCVCRIAYAIPMAYPFWARLMMRVAREPLPEPWMVMEFWDFGDHGPLPSPTDSATSAR